MYSGKFGKEIKGKKRIGGRGKNRGRKRKRVHVKVALAAAKLKNDGRTSRNTSSDERDNYVTKCTVDELRG